MRRFLVKLLVAAVSLPPASVRGAAPEFPAAIAGEVIVQLRDDPIAATTKRNLGVASAASTVDSVLGRYGAKDLVPAFPDVSAGTWPRLRALTRRGTRSGAANGPPDLAGTYIVQVDPRSDLSQLVADLSRDRNVMWAEPNRVYRAAAGALDHPLPLAPTGMNDRSTSPVFNDPYLGTSGSWGQPFADLWGWFAIGATDAWQINQGSGVVAAVVDTGLDTTHRDMRRQVWRNPHEIPGNRIDDDENTFIDDLHGWDFTRCVALNADGSCPQPKLRGRRVRDQVGHGTQIAGIIAAAGNNRQGIVGIAPLAKIMPVKALSDSGNGSTADIAAAIVYGALNGASVINVSITGPASTLMRLAVEFASALDAVVVAAAGNSAIPLQAGVSPANLPEVVAVGATDSFDRLASFSNVGGPLALVAPGGGDSEPAGTNGSENSILSLLARRSSLGIGCRLEFPCEDCPPVTVCSPSPFVIDRSYARAAGTSLSAAFVSGVAALVRSHHPKFTRAQVRQVLFETATDLGPPGWDRMFGYGRIDARRAVAISATPVAEISQPTNGGKIYRWQWPFTVVGTATAPQGAFSAWELILRQAGTTGAIVTRTGRESVESAPLMVLAAGDVERGKRYILELTSTDTDGNVAHDTKEFLVPDHKFVPVPFPAPIAAGLPVRLSRDGARILTTQFTDRMLQAWFFDVRTNTLLRLDHTQRDSLSGWMTPDGSLLSYAGALPDGTYCDDVSTPLQSSVVFEVDPGTYRCLPRGVEVQPAFAVDASGRRSVFVSNYDLDPDRGNPERRFQLFMFDEREGRVRQLTDVPEKPFGDTPVVIRSPTIDDSGQIVAFEATVPLDPDHPFEPTGVQQVFVYNDRDGSIRQLSGTDPETPNGSCASLSGDGRSLAFESAAGLYIADTASGALQRILDGSISFSCPLMSADGRSVAFGAVADLDPRVENEDLNGEVFVFHVASGAFTQVTDTEWLPDCNRNRGGCSPGVVAINGDATSFVAVTAFSPKSVSAPILLSTMRVVPIKEGNRDPILTVPAEARIPTRQPSRITVRAVDSDGDHLTFVANRVPWSRHARLEDLGDYKLDDHGDGSAELEFTPSDAEAGHYTIRVAAFDEHGGMTVQDLRLTIDAGGGR